MDLGLILRDVAVDGRENSEYYPLDRPVVEKYLTRILEFNNDDIIIECLLLRSDLFAEAFFLCVPELWKTVDIQDVIRLNRSLNDADAKWSLMKFSYSCLQIDILPAIVDQLTREYDSRIKFEIEGYLQKQFTELLPIPSLLFEERLIDMKVKVSEWDYLKVKFKLDPLYKAPVIESDLLEGYINELRERLV